MNKIKYIICAVIISSGMVFCTIYNYFSIPAQYTQTLAEGVWFQKSFGDTFIYPIGLNKSVFLLRILHLPLEPENKVVFFGDKVIKPFKISIANHIETDWFYLKSMCTEDKRLLVHFTSLAPPEVQILMRNYYGKVGNFLVIPFYSSYPRTHSFVDFTVSFLILFISLALVSYALRIKTTSYARAKAYACINTSVFLLLLCILTISNILLKPFLIVLLERAFLITLFFSVWGIGLTLFLLKIDTRIADYMRQAARYDSLFFTFAAFLMLAALSSSLALNNISEYACLAAYFFLCWYAMARMKDSLLTKEGP